jgi:DNA-binding IclR family transcriptional regulator
MQLMDKILGVLEVYLSRQDEISLNEIAELTNMNVTTAHRVCNGLVKRAYLYQKDKGKNYSLGIKFLQFCQINNLLVTMKEISLPHLTRFHKEISETILLSVLSGADLYDVVRLYPRHILQTAVGPIEDSKSLHCTGTGKVLLAYKHRDVVDKLIATQGLSAFTKYTITDLPRFHRELAKVRREGVAYDNQEYAIGVRSASAPVRDETGTVFAALAFLAPTIRLTMQNVKEYTPRLKECAADISAAFGYKEK